jgi:hypothetical protein
MDNVIPASALTGTKTASTGEPVSAAICSSTRVKSSTMARKAASS